MQKGRPQVSYFLPQKYKHLIQIQKNPNKIKYLRLAEEDEQELTRVKKHT